MKDQNNSMKEELIEETKKDQNNKKSIIKLEEDEEDEKKRFMKYSPLITLLLMSLGPLSNLVSAVFETLNMFFITKKYNKIENSYAIEILGFSSQYQTIVSIAGVFFGQCFVTRVSALIGSGEREEAAHLVSDIFKLVFFVSLIVNIPMGFLINPILKFVGTPDIVMKKAFNYNFFLLLFVPFSNLFVATQSYFQSIGKVIFLAILISISKIVQTLIFTPFFLFACNVSATYMKASKVLTDILFSFGILIFIYWGKFSLKPTIKMLFSFKLSKYTLKSLLYPLPILFGYIGSVIPPMLILQCLTSQAESTNISNAIGSVFAVFTQLHSVNQALPSAIGVGFLTAGNHAYGSKNIRRFKILLFWAASLSIAFGLLFSLIFVVFNKKIAACFIDNELELEISSKLLPIPFYTSFQQCFGVVVYSTLLILKKPLISMIPSLTQMIVLCAGCEILKVIYKSDYVQIMYAYNIADIIGLIIYISIFIYSLYLIKNAQNEINHEELTSLSIADNLESNKTDTVNIDLSNSESSK